MEVEHSAIVHIVHKVENNAKDHAADNDELDEEKSDLAPLGIHGDDTAEPVFQINFTVEVDNLVKKNFPPHGDLLVPSSIRIHN